MQNYQSIEEANLHSRFDQTCEFKTIPLPIMNLVVYTCFVKTNIDN